MLCAQCKAPLPSGAKFCTACGASLPETPASAPVSAPESAPAARPRGTLLLTALIAAAVLVGAAVVVLALHLYGPKARPAADPGGSAQLPPVAQTAPEPEPARTFTVETWFTLQRDTVGPENYGDQTGQYHYDLRVPRVAEDTPGAREINARLEETFGPLALGELESWGAAHCRWLEADYTVYPGEIAALCVDTAFAELSSGISYAPMLFYYDCARGALLTPAEYAAAHGWSLDDLRSAYARWWEATVWEEPPQSSALDYEDMYFVFTEGGAVEFRQAVSY